MLVVKEFDDVVDVFVFEVDEFNVFVFEDGECFFGYFLWEVEVFFLEFGVVGLRDVDVGYVFC